MSVISVFSSLGWRLLSGGWNWPDTATPLSRGTKLWPLQNPKDLSLNLIQRSDTLPSYWRSLAANESEHAKPTSPPSFVVIHSHANPESKSPYAWTNLINTHHILTHPALSFSSLIRWLFYERWLDNVAWPWTRHTTLRGLCFQPTPLFSSLDQPHLCESSARLLITKSLAMHQLLKMPTTLLD